MRVDTAGAVEIVRAAAGFGWRWGSGNVSEFARLVGWSSPQPVGTLRSGPVFSRTGLSVWWDSAMFWGSDRGLDHVRVTISDCPAPAESGSRELLEAALARAAAVFTERWGDPESPSAGPSEGMAWRFPNVFAGLTIGVDTIDLLLIAVRPDYQKKGVNAMILYHAMLGCFKLGIKEAEVGKMIAGYFL